MTNTTRMTEILSPDALTGVPAAWIERLEREAPAIVAYHTSHGVDPAPLLADLAEIGRRAGDRPIDRYAIGSQEYWSIGAVATAALLYRHPERRVFYDAADFSTFVESVMEGYHESEMRWREMTGGPSWRYIDRFGHRPPGLAEAERKRREQLAWLTGEDGDGAGYNPREG